MAECRHLLCLQPAEFEVTVRYFGGVRERKALYCAEHLSVVRLNLATRETSEITNIRPLRGTAMTEESPSAAAENLITNLKHERARLNDENQNLERVNADLKRDVAAADAAIGRLKNTNNTLAEEIGDLRKSRDALVEHLHALANAFEAEGSMVYRDTIDEKLEELGLPSRLKHFHLVFTVPTQIRLEGDYPSKEAMQAAFEAGSINWNVSDYEEILDDDTKIIMIEEAPE